MKEKLFQHIEEKFPGLSHEIHLRFELGEPFDNGTDERINQVLKRVTTLFEEIFCSEDILYLLIKDWGIGEDPMFGNTTPNYIYDLLCNHRVEEETLFELDEDLDDSGNTVEIRREYSAKVIFSQIKLIPYKEILQGIGHYEQGREPSIGQTVYFISTEKNVIFDMYDDRGCIIFADSKDKLLPLYKKYNDWLVDYWRELFDGMFGQA